MDTEREYYIFKRLEALRKTLRNSKELIPHEDYGAGSAYFNSGKEIFLSNIAKTAISDQKKCRTLFNLVNFMNTDTILELGTSAGLSSAYMASANRGAKVVTLEGNRRLAQIASELHKDAGLQNIEILPGRFEDTLALAISKLNSIDIAFIDGNHRYDATLKYFNTILPHCHSKSVIVLDDIYWSSEMQDAWRDIRMSPELTLKLDVFELGFAFLNPDLSKENVKYIPFWCKPWKVGLFGK